MFSPILDVSFRPKRHFVFVFQSGLKKYVITLKNDPTNFDHYIDLAVNAILGGYIPIRGPRSKIEGH